MASETAGMDISLLFLFFFLFARKRKQMNVIPHATAVVQRRATTRVPCQLLVEEGATNFHCMNNWLCFFLFSCLLGLVENGSISKCTLEKYRKGKSAVPSYLLCSRLIWLKTSWKTNELLHLSFKTPKKKKRKKNTSCVRKYCVISFDLTFDLEKISFDYIAVFDFFASILQFSEAVDFKAIYRKIATNLAFPRLLVFLVRRNKRSS